MLVVITTDAVVPAADLDTALRAATRVSFDRLDSDGCMSTNDTVTVLASGASGITPSLPDFTDGAHPGLHRPRDAAAPRRRGRRPRDRDHRAQRRHRGRGGRGRPQRRPLQPVQGGRLRQRPQLGPRARQHRHDAGAVRPRRPRRRDERRLGLQAVHAARRPRDRRPEAPRGERDHRPQGRARAGDRLDQRPDPRLRPREQRVLAHERLEHRPATTPASRTRRRPAPSRPRCRG